jgi:hypothetical protein
MKLSAFFVLLITIVASCTPKVQVVTLRGSNVQPDNEGLVLDNDTLTLRYSFSSERGQMNISLVNKLNQPLYIDWKRSSFIIGQEKLDYWHDVASIDLAESTYGSRYGRYSISSIQGTVSKEDQITFIPPQTKVSKQQFVVYPNGILSLPGTPELIEEKPTWNPGRKKPVVISNYKYPAPQSPLTFRNYLTLSTDKDFKTEFHIDTKFWASDVQILPRDQVFSQFNGTYTLPVSFKKPDGFYITLPTE